MLDLQTAITNIRAELDTLEQRKVELGLSLRLLEAEGERLIPAMALLRQYGKAAKARADGELPKTKRGLVELIINTAPQAVRLPDIIARATELGRLDVARDTDLANITAALVTTRRARRIQPGLYWKIDTAKGDKAIAKMRANGNGNGNGHKLDIITALKQALGDEPQSSAALTMAVKSSIPSHVHNKLAWVANKLNNHSKEIGVRRIGERKASRYVSA